MIVKPTYVFNPKNGQNSKKFDTPEELLEHIKNYDYLREYYNDNKLTGRVMRSKEKGFSVSAHFKFDLEEISMESYNFHTRVFYIGQSAVKTNNGVQITVLHHPTKIEEEVHEKYSAYAQDCVIDSKNLKQIYPPVDKFEDSELAKWIKQIESMKYNIQKVK